MKKNDAAGEGMRSSRRTPHTAVNAKDQGRPESQWVYRYWVEICDLRDRSARTLPLHVMRLVHLGAKHGEPLQSEEQLLQLQDNATTIEATDIAELAAQLERKYPDETHERRLHWERDLEAERRRADAMQSLVEFLVETAVNDVLREHEADRNAAART